MLLPFKTFTVTSQALLDSSDFDVSISRNFTRLCTIFINFNREETATDKDVNKFYSPVATTGQDNFESFLQIGNKRWSDGPRIGSAQHYYLMLNARGYANSIVSSANINQVAYNSKSFHALRDCEKVPQAAMSGHNTRRGQMITASFKQFGTQTNNRA